MRLYSFTLMQFNASPPPQGGLSAEACAARATGLAPSLIRRMAAFVYEGVLLFGVTMVVGFVYSIGTHQTNALYGRNGMQAVQFFALALYFIWFWTHGGQTLAMRSWQLRLVNDHGLPITLKQALTRFMLSWVWFLPSFLVSWMAGWHQSKLLYGAMLIWIAAYALLSLLHPQRQFWHDAISGTRVIDNRS
ncbi:MAG TPA: RDD family protein [Aquabacterium sp.]|nr:RDD family protein [Aquabacterium sp.]